MNNNRIVIKVSKDTDILKVVNQLRRIEGLTNIAFKYKGV